MEPTPLYLRAANALSPSPPAGAEGQHDTVEYDPRVGRCAGQHGGGPFVPSWTLPLDQRADEALSLCFTSDAFSVRPLPTAALADVKQAESVWLGRTG